MRLKPVDSDSPVEAVDIASVAVDNSAVVATAVETVEVVAAAAVAVVALALAVDY